MAIEKQNDWLVSIINQPDFSMKDFLDIGLSKDNTELMDRDFYKEKDYFRNQFINPETHEFDEAKFDKFYDQAVEKFNAFEIVKGQAKFLDTAEFSYNNLFARDNAKRTKNQFDLVKVQNPYGTKVGIEGINVVTEGPLTQFEIAQNNFLRDADGNVLDITANDLGTLKTMFGNETWVLDTYEEDGEHFNADGRKVRHFKGEAILDEDGKPYLRALRAGEDVSRKRVLNWTDNMTKDGSYWNKWDPFDADGKDVGVAKIVVKSALKLAPLLAGVIHPALAPIALGYTGLTASLSLAQTLPTLAKAINGVFNDGKDVGDRSALWNAMNEIEGFGNRFKGSTSEYSHNKMFTFENIAAMLTDVPLQLQQQQFVAKIPGWLGANKSILQGAEFEKEIGKRISSIIRKSINDPSINVNAATRATMKELMEANAKSIADYQNIARTLSSTYMGITSMGHSWASALADGHDERTAGIIAMGTFAGLYSLMRYTNLGYWSLKQMGLDESRLALKKSVQDGLKEWGEQFASKYTQYGKKEVEKALFNRFKGISEKFTQGLASSATIGQKMFTGALGEAIEEMSEEAVYDGINVLANIGVFGETKGHHDFTLKDIVGRYMMSALAGAAGGAIHVGINAFQNRTTDLHKALDKDTRQELEYMTYKYGADAVIEEIEKQYKKGIIPLDNSFSMTSFNTNSDGETVAKLASDESDTAAYAIKESMKNLVLSYSNILRGFTEGNFDNDIMLATRGNERLGKLIDLKSITTVKEDFMNVVSEYIDSRMELAGLADGATATAEQNKKVTESAAKIEKFLKGEYFADYAEMASFILDDELSSNFIAKSVNDYAQLVKDKNYEALNDEEKSEIKKEYDEYTGKTRNDQLKLAYDKFKNINIKNSKAITEFFTGYKATRDITMNNMAKFDELFNRLQFDANNLVGMEANRKKGIFEDLVAINNDLVVSLDNIDNYLNQYTDGVDHYTSFLMKDKIEAIRSSFKTNPKVEFIAADLPNLNRIGTDLPRVLENILTFNLLDGSKDAVEKINALTTGDNASEYYLSEEAISKIDLGEYFDGNFPEVEAEARRLGVNSYNIDLTQEKDLELFKFILNLVVDEISKAPRAFNPDVIRDKVDAINAKLENAKTNPIYELLDQMGKGSSTSYTNVLRILKEEDVRLRTAVNLTDYVLDSPERYGELKQLKNNLLILGSLINAAKTYDIDNDQYGFNKLVNDIQKSFGVDTAEELAVISADDAIVIGKELDILMNKVNYLLQLAEFNDADKLRAQKKAMVKIQTLQYQKAMHMIEKLVKNVSIPDQLKTALGDFMTKISLDNSALLLKGDAQDILNQFDVYNEETLIKFESFLTKFENGIRSIFMQFEKDGGVLDYEQFFDELIDASFPDSRLDFELTTEVSESSKELTDYDAVVYFATCMSISTSNVKSVLLDKLLNDPEYKYAPIFSQEYPVRIAAAMENNPNAFNAILTKLIKIRQKHAPKDVVRVPLKNFTYIRGFHGSGKSSATLNLIDYYFKKIGKTITASAIVESQVDNLKRLLGRDDIYNKQEMIDMLDMGDLSSHLVSDSDYEAKNDIIEDKIKKIKGDLTGKLGDIIYIDETTHYTAFQLQFMSRFAEATGRRFIVLGDQLQEGAFYNNSENNIEYAFKIMSPTMEFSMRANNIHVKDNNNQVRSAASLVTKKVIDSVPASEINKFYSQVISEMEFNYHQEAGSFTGSKFVNSVTEEDVLDLIKSDKENKIGYIYENVTSPTYSLMESLKSAGHNITMLHKDSVQGLEMDHFIIDVDLTYKNNSYIKHSKLINTIFSRSREGSIILRNGSEFKSKEVGYTRNTGLSETELQKYKEQRINVLTKVLEENPETEELKSAVKAAEAKASLGNLSEEEAKLVTTLMVGETEEAETPKEKAEEASRVSPKYSVTLYTGNNYIGAEIDVTEEEVVRDGIKTKIKTASISRENALNSLTDSNGNTVEFYRDFSGFLKNGDDGIVGYTDAAPKLDALSSFRQAMLQTGSYSEVPDYILDTLFSRLKGSVNDSMIDDIEDAYDWENGVWKVVITPPNPKRLRSLKGDPKTLPGDQFLPQLVYEVESTDGEPNLQITIADLHRETFKNDFPDETRFITGHKNGYVEIELSDSSIKNILTASKAANRYRKGTDENKISLRQLENVGRGLIVSDMYIPGSDQGNIINPKSGEPVFKDYKGRPIVFICTEPNAYFPKISAGLNSEGEPNEYTSERLDKDNLARYFAEYYKERQINPDGPHYYKPIVQFQRLHVKGDYNHFKQYLGAFAQMRDDLLRDGTIAKELYTKFDSYMGARMLLGLYNRYGAMSAKAKAGKISNGSKEEREFRLITAMTAMINGYLNLHVEVDPETGDILNITYGDSDWEIDNFDTNAPKGKKIELKSLDNTERLNKVANLFAEPYKSLYRIMDMFSRMLTIEPGAALTKYTKFNISEAEEAINLMQNIFTNNKVTYNKANNKYDEIPDSVSLRGSFYPHPIIASENVKGSFVYKAYMTDNLKKNFLLPNIPLGRQYYLDLSGVKTGSPVTSPVVTTLPPIVPPVSPAAGTSPSVVPAPTLGSSTLTPAQQMASKIGTWNHSILNAVSKIIGVNYTELTEDIVTNNYDHIINTLEKGNIVDVNGTWYVAKYDLSSNNVTAFVAADMIETIFRSQGLTMPAGMGLKQVGNQLIAENKDYKITLDLNSFKSTFTKLNPEMSEEEKNEKKFKENFNIILNGIEEDFIKDYIKSLSIPVVGVDAQVQINGQLRGKYIEHGGKIYYNMWVGNGKDIPFGSEVHYKVIDNSDNRIKSVSYSLNHYTFEYDDRFEVYQNGNLESTRYKSMPEPTVKGKTNEVKEETLDSNSEKISEIKNNVVSLLIDSTNTSDLDILFDLNQSPDMNVLARIYDNIKPESINDFNNLLAEYLNIKCS